MYVFFIKGFIQIDVSKKHDVSLYFNGVKIWNLINSVIK